MLASKIVQAVRSVIGDAPAALHEPLFDPNDSVYTSDCIINNQVTQGGYVERFENELAEFLGAKHVIATCNATCALNAVYRHIYKPRELIMMPALTFVATANALVQMGAEPLFTDYNDGTRVAVPILGHPVYSPYRVQDASQALGSMVGDKYVGSSGTAVFSFNGNKIITTGGGGAIATDDGDLSDALRKYISTARIAHKWEIDHESLACNYRMPNINAAIGCAQLEALPYILRVKRKLAEQYIEAFDGVEGVTFWKEPEGATSNYWLCSIILSDPADQEPTLRALHDAGYLSRMLPRPLDELPMYSHCESTPLQKTKELYQRVICLPSSPSLGVRYA